jgi:hypothetical protein
VFMKKAEFKMGENKDSVEAMTKTRTHMDTLACVSVSHCIRPQSCNAWQQEPVSYLHMCIAQVSNSQILLRQSPAESGEAQQLAATPIPR